MKFGRQKEDSTSVPLFQNVVFQFHKTLSVHKQQHLKTLLEENGAVAATNAEINDLDTSTPSNVTHIISLKSLNTEKSEDDQGKPPFVVTPQWVEAGVRNGFVHDPEFYLPSPENFFSGVVVCATGIPKNDIETIYGGVLASGGQFRTELENDVTHLIILVPEGEMYQKALKRGIKVVLPHWVDRCFKLRRFVREDLFQFPDPPALQDQTSPRLERDMIKEEESEANKPLQGLIYPYPHKMLLMTTRAETKFLAGKRFYFDPELGIEEEMQTDLANALEDAGATIVKEYEPEQVDVVVTKYRSTKAYIRACQDSKTVGTVWWVTNTLARQRFESPMRTLLDYPVPSGGIPGMENLCITLTGYKNIARDFLRRLAALCGMRLSPSLTKETTHLICASKNSRKYLQARQWNISVVNHIWLEECYQGWVYKSVADERYVYFPGGSILKELVGQTPILPEVVEAWWKDPNNPPKEVPRRPMQHPPWDSPITIDTEKTEERDTPSVSATHPRKAALEASATLHDIVVPDMNQYQKERRNKRARSVELTDSDTKRQRTEEDAAAAALEQPAEETSVVPGRLETEKEATDSDENAAVMTEIHEEKPKDERTTAVEAHKEEKAAQQAANSPETMDKQRSPSPAPKLQYPTIQEKATLPISPEPETSTRPEKKPATTTRKAEPSPEHEKPVKRLREKDAEQGPKTYKIVTTGIQLTAEEKSALRRLGAHMTENVANATHLIVEKRALRTPKFLCAVNLGLRVLTIRWIHESIRKKAWQDEEKYAVKDPDMETKFKFDLRESLEKARENVVVEPKKKAAHGVWLADYDVCLLQSSKSVLKEVIETAGGKVIPKPNARRLRELGESNRQKLLVLSTAEEKDKWTEFTRLGIPIYDVELVIVGALRQRLDLEEFCLAK